MASQANGVFVRAARVVRRQAATLFAAALWPFALNLLLLVLFGLCIRLSHSEERPLDPITLWHQMSWGAKSSVLLAWAFCTSVPHSLALATISVIVSEEGIGKRLSVANALRRVGHHAGSVIAVGFAIGCASIIGTVLFILPAIALWIFTAFTIPAMVIDHEGVGLALQRSRIYAKKRFSDLLGLYLSLVVFGIVASSIISVLSPENHVNSMIFGWTFLLFLPTAMEMFFGTMLVLLFLDTRAGGETSAAAAGA